MTENDEMITMKPSNGYSTNILPSSTKKRRKKIPAYKNLATFPSFLYIFKKFKRTFFHIIRESGHKMTEIR